MAKMKTLLDATIEHHSKKHRLPLEYVEGNLTDQLSKEGREAYPWLLSQCEVVGKSIPLADTRTQQRILSKVIEDGWCIETDAEAVRFPSETLLLKTYGLVDILGYEVIAVVPLSEGVDDAVWVDKLKSDINLLVAECVGESRLESQPHPTGLPSELDLHFTTLKSRSILGSTDPENTTGFTFTNDNSFFVDTIANSSYARRNPTSKSILARSENRPYTSEASFDLGVVEPGIDPTRKFATLEELDYVNESLKDVDPYSPNLTAEERNAILEECRVNPHYYFMKVLRMADYSKTDVQGWRRTCALGLLEGKLDECVNRSYGEVVVLDISSPLRTYDTVPYRIWCRPSVSVGEWKMIEFMTRYLVK